MRWLLSIESGSDMGSRFKPGMAISTGFSHPSVDDPVSAMVSYIKAEAVDCIHLYGSWTPRTVKGIIERFEFAELAFAESQFSSVEILTRDSTLPMSVACTPQMILATKPNGEFLDALRSMGKRFDETRFVVIEHHYNDEMGDTESFLLEQGFHLQEIAGGSGIFIASLYHRVMPPTTNSRQR